MPAPGPALTNEDVNGRTRTVRRPWTFGAGLTSNAQIVVTTGGIDVQVGDLILRNGHLQIDSVDGNDLEVSVDYHNVLTTANYPVDRIVTYVRAATTGSLKLVDGNVGRTYLIYCYDSVVVYPPTGHLFYGKLTNSPFTLPSRYGALVHKYATSDWIAFRTGGIL